MSGRGSLTLTAIVAVASLVAPGWAGSAIGADLRPLELRVEGGEEAWHADRSFGLYWTNPPLPAGRSVAAVHYRLLDPAGQLALAEVRIGWAATSIERLRVPAAPGAYTAELWLEDGAGAEGEPATARLRFDDMRPGQVAPLSSSGWIGRTSFPYTLRLDRPAGADPVSGVRGYAISIDRSESGNPCVSFDHCTEAETDLRGGAGGNTMSIADLPEGLSYVHAVGVSGSGMRSANAGHAVLRVDKTDPLTRLAGVPRGWVNHPVTLTATATDAASGMLPTRHANTPFTAIRIDGGPAVVAAGNTVIATVIEAGVHTIASYARDVAGNVADGGFVNGQPNGAPTTAVVWIDRDPPTLAFSSSQNPREPETIEARMSDSLSGPELSRGRIAVRRAGSGERFEELATEVAGDGLLRARWHSEAYPRGEYEFRVTGYDKAGNAASTLLRANGSSMVLRSPLKVSTSLLAGFERRSGVHTVGHGRGASFSGRLIAGRRAPLAGEPVQIVERFGVEPRERVSIVRTGTGGAFTARLAPGPSREVVAVFAAEPTLQSSTSQPARLRVRGGLRMRASSPLATVGGPPVIFRGKVAGTIPADGKLVQLQFRLPGLPWTEFRTLRTDPRGRFSYSYRFADDDSRGVRFQFRAFAPTQAGWPYEPAGSRPLFVRGR